MKTCLAWAKIFIYGHNKRELIIGMKYLFALLLFFSGLNAEAQIERYKHQLQLVDSVRVYIKNTLHLNIGNDFYTKWSTQKDSMYYYVYVSDAQKIQSTLDVAFITYNKEDTAIVAANNFTMQGFHALVYKTAGTSNAELTPKLLSYPDEAIAFIMVHEAVHRHISSLHLKPGYPYSFEECLCDAVANSACVAMAKTLKLLASKAAISQKKIFERVYVYINSQDKKLVPADTVMQALIFSKTTSHIKTMVRNGNQFQKDRMIYPVNNAYFLRNRSYTTHYFELLQMLNGQLSMNDVINKIYKREVQH